MRSEDLFALAESMGFVRGHYMKLKDLKSGATITGVFTKYRPCKNSLVMRGFDFGVEVITDGKPNFEILKSVDLVKARDEKLRRKGYRNS